MEKTEIQINALTINVEDKLILLFNSVMTIISSFINDLVSNYSLMIMSKRNTHE